MAAAVGSAAAQLMALAQAAQAAEAPIVPVDPSTYVPSPLEPSWQVGACLVFPRAKHAACPVHLNALLWHAHGVAFCTPAFMSAGKCDSSCRHILQVWFGAFVSVVPFVIGAYEFTKRIVSGCVAGVGVRPQQLAATAKPCLC
jgi:hypothetical protein